MDLPRGLLYPIFVAVAVAAGLALPFQAGINGQLRMYLGHPLRASLGNFSVGLVLLLLLTTLIREPWPAVHDVLRGPWWMWLGGTLGTLYVVSTIFVLPRLGASVTFALVVSGQMLASLAIDKLGLFGLTPTPLSAARAAGALLVVGGVYLLQR
jgi:transporter family-2 protein